MDIDHGGADITVAEQFLDGADVITTFEQMGGKGMAQGMGRGGFVYTTGSNRLFDGALQSLFMRMVTAHNAGSRITRQSGRREDPEPAPFKRRFRILARQRQWQLDPGPLQHDLVPTDCAPAPGEPQVRCATIAAALSGDLSRLSRRVP